MNCVCSEILYTSFSSLVFFTGTFFIAPFFSCVLIFVIFAYNFFSIVLSSIGYLYLHYHMLPNIFISYSIFYSIWVMLSIVLLGICIIPFSWDVSVISNIWFVFAPFLYNGMLIFVADSYFFLVHIYILICLISWIYLTILLPLGKFRSDLILVIFLGLCVFLDSSYIVYLSQFICSCCIHYWKEVLEHLG